jgi:hypothetical protein
MTDQDSALDPLPLHLPVAEATSALVLAQLEAWLDAILAERAARDTRE